MSSSLFHITERHHSGLILMTALARRFRDDRASYVTLQEVAQAMRLSSGYLEEIAAAFKREKLIEGRTGPNGGYRLAMHPKKISVERVLAALDGAVVLVDCQKDGVECPVEGQCVSKSVWGKLQKEIRATLSRMKLHDVV